MSSEPELGIKSVVAGTGIVFRSPKYYMVFTDQFYVTIYEKPNWFYRLTQRLILGITYKKIS